MLTRTHIATRMQTPDNSASSRQMAVLGLLEPALLACGCKSISLVMTLASDRLSIVGSVAELDLHDQNTGMYTGHNDAMPLRNKAPGGLIDCAAKHSTRSDTGLHTVTGSHYSGSNHPENLAPTQSLHATGQNL